MPWMETPVNTARVAGEPFYRARNAVPYAMAMAAVAGFSFLSGGYVIGRSTPVAVGLLCAAAVWVWFLRRSTRPPILLLAALGVFGAFTVWSGLSVLWSFGPDLTWVSFNLTAFYLAVAAVLGLTSARGLQLWTVAYGYLAVATAVGVYAFLGKGLPAVVTHAHTYARLDSPVGYWNVLALLMVMGIVVSLAVAGDRTTSTPVRTLAAVAAVPMSFAFFFTFSRGGWIALLVAFVLYFAFTSTRLASFVTLVAVATPVTLVLWRLRSLETLFTETSDDALRILQGGALLRWAIAALLVTAGVQLAVALLHRSVSWPRWSAVVAGAAVLAIVGVVVLGGSGRYIQSHGGASWVEDRLHALVTDADTEGGGNAAGRLTTLTTNGRIDLWREAARQSRFARVSGTGAGTFPFAHYRFRESGGVVKHAHSQWFNVLSELGAVGLALFVVSVLLFVAAMVGNPFARRSDPLHPLLVALQAGVIAYIVHITVDWDWDMAAIGALAFVFIAVCASYRSTSRADELRSGRRAIRATEAAEEPAPFPANPGTVHTGDSSEHAGPADWEGHAPVYPGAPADAADEVTEDAAAAQDAEIGDDAQRRTASRRRSRRVGWAPRVVASAALVLLALSWLSPYLALRAENAALAAASDGDVTAALADVSRAATLDPLAVSPLITQATLLQQLGRNREALERLETAAKLQPQNYEVWYELGVLQHGALGRDKAARASFARALALNPSDAASRYELELLAR